MKIEYGDYCTSQSLSIDGEESNQVSLDKLKKAIHLLIDNEDNLQTLKEICCSLVEVQGECIENYICEECGDSNCKYIIEV